jgi:hypothetical protein
MVENLADDLLLGAKAIAIYVFGDGDKRHRRKIYHRHEKREWPIWKQGQDLASRKSLLSAHFDPANKIIAAE